MLDGIPPMGAFGRAMMYGSDPIPMMDTLVRGLKDAGVAGSPSTKRVARIKAITGAVSSLVAMAIPLPGIGVASMAIRAHYKGKKDDRGGGYSAGGYNKGGYKKGGYKKGGYKKGGYR